MIQMRCAVGAGCREERLATVVDDSHLDLARRKLLMNLEVKYHVNGCIGGEGGGAYRDGVELECAHTRMARLPDDVVLASLLEVCPDDFRSAARHNHPPLAKPDFPLTDAWPTGHV